MARGVHAIRRSAAPGSGSSRTALLLVGLIGLIGLGSVFGSGCARQEQAARLGPGPHEGLACAACHRGPDGTRFASGATCSGCHDPADSSPEVRHGGVLLSHPEHGELQPGGIPTYCASCHVHSSGHEDLRVDAGSCVLCHAELPGPARGNAPGARAARFPEGSCLGCHPEPDHTAFANTGVPVDHELVLARGISCTQCHHDLVQGEGEVDAAACRSCHEAWGRTSVVDGPHDAATVHRAHTGGSNGPACGRCHAAVTHQVGSLSSSLVLVCQVCHDRSDRALTPPIDAQAHRPEQLLYTGLGSEPGAAPARHFLERVSCRDCHSDDAMRHPVGSEPGVRAIAGECAACHGPGHRGLLAGWIRGVERRTEEVGRYVRAAASHRRLRESEAGASARTALRSWESLQEAHGVHNVPAADAILRGILADAQAAYRSAGLEPPPPPSLGPDPATDSCARCHYGLELSAGPRDRAKSFDHGIHVGQAALDCRRCHSAGEPPTRDPASDGPPHGLVTVSETDCMRCHHGSEGAGAGARGGGCVACHDPGELAGTRTATVRVAVGEGDARARPASWSHGDHASLECVSCHANPVHRRPAEDVASCVACHEQHHSGDTNCLACHGGGRLMDAHEFPLGSHAACSACHRPDTVALLLPERGFCLTCHGAGSAHYAETGNTCSECHFLATPDELRPMLTGSGRPGSGD